MTQFTVDLNTLGNLAIAKNVSGELDSVTQKVAFAMSAWVIPTIILVMSDTARDWVWELLGWREPEDWEERKDQIAVDTVKYGVGQFTGYIPILGGVIDAQAMRILANADNKRAKEELYFTSSVGIPALAGVERLMTADSWKDVIAGFNTLGGNPFTQVIDNIWKQLEDED